MAGEEYNKLKTSLDRIEKITLIGVKNVLTVDDVATIAGLSKAHIYRLTSSQEITHYKPTGGKIYFKKEEIEEWLLQNRVCTTQEIQSSADTIITVRKIKNKENYIQLPKIASQQETKI